MADQRNQLQPADLLHRQIQSAPVLWSRALYLSLYPGILLFPLIQIGSNDAIPDWGNQANQQNRKIAIGHLGAWIRRSSFQNCTLGFSWCAECRVRENKTIAFMRLFVFQECSGLTGVLGALVSS